jgi:hypothetical protein
VGEVSRQSRSGNQPYTLVIHDDDTIDQARELAEHSHLPCFPFEAITDYLMQVGKQIPNNTEI